MPIFLHGLALRFYRGIGPKTVQLAPFKEFNFFIGANNSGKSTVLNFLSSHLGPSLANTRATRIALSSLEQYRGKETGRTTLSIAIPVDKFTVACTDLISDQNDRRHLTPTISSICGFLAEKDHVWLTTTVPASGDFSLRVGPEELSQVPGITRDLWYNTWRSITGASGGDLHRHWLPDLHRHFMQAQSTVLPEVKLIPAIRQIGPKGSAFSDFSGHGLIDRLAEIQSPDHDMRHERELFDKINAFLQQVTGRETAEIEVPHNREHILVHMDNKVLPLASLGTGIHEVIMIAAFCTLSENQIVCIEEPELHLHPLLQRKLVRYLKEYTSNQYFIATHSAAFIDTPGAAIFHVTNDGEQTYIRESILRSERHSICTDLGYKASDIVQSNAVIWVEGPSDRIYIQHWIKALAPNLIEGIHYSIMFYGGRLLSHLSADAEEISEFIALKALNQNLALVMDSDRKNSRDTINGTKQRLASEFAQGAGVAWITKGREIENYIDHAVLQAVVKEIYSTVYAEPTDGGPYGHALHFKRALPKRRHKKTAEASPDLIEKDVDKVKVARIVCSQTPDLGVLDLKDRIEEIISMIQRANR